MRRLFLVVLLLALAGAVAVQAGQYGAGFWLGERNLGVPSGTGGIVTVNLMESGGHFTWEPLKHLALRGSVAYNTGEFSTKTTMSDPGGSTTTEHKDDVTGYPIEVNVLPTFRVGEWLVVRAGGGLAYHTYSDMYTTTATSGGVTFSYTYPSASLSGIGGQFLLVTEAKLCKNLSLEAQYKKDNASLNYSWDYPSGNTPETYHIRETFGIASETYRIGLTFGF